MNRLHNKTSKEFFVWETVNAFYQLRVFLQLIEQHGWQPMIKFMADYEVDIKNKTNIPTTNQQKIDQWVIRYSRILGKNIKSHFQAWGLTTSTDADQSLIGLPYLCPLDDEYKSSNQASKERDFNLFGSYC